MTQIRKLLSFTLGKQHSYNMELQTRQLTFEERYFRQPNTLHLPTATTQNPTYNGLLKSGALFPNTEFIQITPPVDLSNHVFPSPSFSERAGKFLDKNWLWVILGIGTAVVVTVAVYKNHQNKKEQGHINPNSQPQ